MSLLRRPTVRIVNDGAPDLQGLAEKETIFVFLPRLTPLPALTFMNAVNFHFSMLSNLRLTGTKLNSGLVKAEYNGASMFCVTA